ncbi:sialic acid-binding Ig-like lectin 16 [Eleutherodactylus coqui]|uniref:sialic acid-binding Ig-like lectin 16 n=1 Tax=Eleutherodactylus coqui TaxID=57060 RepID=UPI00346245D6
MIPFTLENCLFFTFLMLQIWDIGCQTNKYVISVPEEVTAQVGLCVHIPCSFTVPSYVEINELADGFWYREKWSQHKVVASNKDNSRGRFFFTGDVSSRDCSLFINDIQESDDSYYYFRLEDSVQYSYWKIKPHLKVTGLTDKPEISVGKLVAGEKATITCKSPGICAGSAPDITWNGKHGEKLPFSNSYPNSTSIYFSNFTFTPTKEDNGSPLTCIVAFRQYMAVTQQIINLNVEYPPDVTITIREPFPRSLPPQSVHRSSPASATSDTFIVKEGDSKMIDCMVDSNPLAVITWFVGGELKKGPTNESTLIYSLKNISLNDAGKYLCTGRNDHGSSTKTIEIIVHYPPRPPNIICRTTEDCIMDKQRMIYILENSTLSLLCTAESLPEASLSWKVSGPSTNRSGVNGHLTLHNVSLSDDGQFTCVASNNYGKSVALANIKVTYKPRTVTGKNSSCRDHGGHTECACIIQSSPTADIQWNINEKVYSSNHSDKELNIFTVKVNAVTNSTLILKSSWVNIRTVRCMSSNKHGRLELLLLEGNIGIIAAISCVTVVVLLLIGGFVVMHHIRKKKLAMKPEDKKEINADDCSVIYSNSEVHIYGNQMTKIGTGSVDSVQDDSDTCSYMNVEDVEYTTINFSKLEAKNAVENDEIEYAEVKK